MSSLPQDTQEPITLGELGGWLARWGTELVQERWGKGGGQSAALTTHHTAHPAKQDHWDLDRPLFQLSPQDVFTLRHAYEGIMCLGGIGSGKSSGSLQTIAKSLLRAQFGMLILTSTPDEVETWRHWTEETGRANDLIVLEPGGEDPHQFDFLAEEAKAGEGAFLGENLVILLTEVNSIIQGKASAEGQENKFFQDAMRELLRATVTSLLLGDYPVTLDNIRNMMNSAPQTIEEANDEDWIEKTFCGQVLNQAHNRVGEESQANHDLNIATDFWTLQLPRLHQKTRTSITATLTATIDVLSYGIANSMLATKTTITPAAALEEGKILLLNVPIQQYFETGKVIAGIWKYCFQRWALRRDTEDYPHGVALVIDEAHYHLSTYDEVFQSVARRARVVSLYLTQNVSQIYHRYGDHDATHSLLGNFSTKIFHAQADTQSNMYAAELIGKEWRMVSNYSSSMNEMQPGQTVTGGGSEQLIYKLEPSHLTTLRRGGPDNDYQVDGILFRSGHVFHATGDTYIPVIFDQRA